MILLGSDVNLLAPRLPQGRAKSPHSNAASAADTVGTAPQSHSVGWGLSGGLKVQPVRLRVSAWSLPPSSPRSQGLVARFVAVLSLLNSAAWLHQRPSTFPLEAMARKCTIAKLALACLVAWRQHSRPESARCCPILLCRRRSCVFSFPVGRSRSRQVRLGGVLDMQLAGPRGFVCPAGATTSCETRSASLHQEGRGFDIRLLDLCACCKRGHVGGRNCVFGETTEAPGMWSAR